MSETEFPVSDVVARGRGIRSMTLSPMWIVTLVCFLLAVVLTWAALDEPGVWIKIRFDRGHGLKVGDVMMYRGIEVGRVGKLSLRSDLDGIDVHVILERDAAKIATEGSRFWIVRPQVNVQGISGLETAIGSKYLSVIPGDSDRRRQEFDGLETPPPIGADQGGMEIVLRGDDRWGVNPGSPLSWRGIEVGQVLASSLSPDARHVDTRVRVDVRYISLLSKDSKFWVTSGIQMDLGMSGLKLSAESLSTIARGGIAFITPAPIIAEETIGPGEVFRLHRKLKEEWLEQAAAINRFTEEPPRAVRVETQWKESFFGISRSRSRSAWAMAVSTSGDKCGLLVPNTLLDNRDDAIDGSFTLMLVDGDTRVPLSPTAIETADGGTVGFVIDSKLAAGETIAGDRLRDPVGPEDVYAVSWRTEGEQPRGSSSDTGITEMIGRDQMRPDENGWRVLDTLLGADVWNGAPVVSAADEKIVGMLLVGENGTSIARIPAGEFWVEKHHAKEND
ncbi:MlaD family protein [Aporhodopirellula aestuarii]|uniref:MlaD family protein n=1 Tax=Aporhodopirellula aestuarii TaxID=2950107 RepID=A0ABT0U6U9_9BACT|nr:MlaD family protein [Aporhodopirellula aestuarii]MCM2372265.1 MlaD family protein [Aporhodopirellula aestuarii]